ncbi:LOW QUALITY PROTEIN: hypothetical protein CVT26_016060 [Gymnopilus dilepis]|uniref:Uncharacterized protein n=1 Tax=Gymnopilus dilepis TaxID=231916 RepID=A0A409YDP1_9AGAR|nr:LOW QUALITY PROTEIN: hypothetical protein CVT26_016060 [Gymnopilus dilepis]
MFPTVARLSKASRAPLTPKRGNKDFYKGTRQAFLPGGRRTGAPGKHVVRGKAKYRLLDEKVRVYVAPPLEEIESSPLKPYVALGTKLSQDEERAVWGKFRTTGGLSAEHFLRVSREYTYALKNPEEPTPHIKAPPTWLTARLKLGIMPNTDVKDLLSPRGERSRADSPAESKDHPLVADSISKHGMNKVLDFRHETPPLPSVPFSHHLQLAMSDHTQAAKSSATKGVAAVLSGSVTHRTAFNLFCIPGRVAVVTGGHRGIGLEIALALAEAGALVYCLDLPASPDANWKKVERFVNEKLEKSNQAAGLLHGKMYYKQCDVTKQKEVWDLLEGIAQEQGRMDICVANAGILRGEEVLDYPGEDFKKLLDINICGVLYTAQAAGRQMVKHNTHGSIILIGSMSGSIANKDMHWTAYNASKAAILQMARSMACELGSKNIRVNSISPGYVETDMTKAFLETRPELKATWSSHNPLGRLARPDEMRGVALFLASDASTFCTGSDLIVDGGHRAW